jgi:hypothetical protein
MGGIMEQIIKDIAGLSAPMEKLISSISSGIGKIYEPKYIREIAKAKADASIIETNAQVLTLGIQKTAEAEQKIVELQTAERIRFCEERRQRNINKIVVFAAQQLPEKIDITGKVDEDWIITFFNFSQDVGNEELQLIWGKLLAGEVVNPGSYSLRTLNTIKLLRPSEAILFQKLCNYYWEDIGILFHQKQTDYFNNNGLLFIDLKNLEVIGLISMGVCLSLDLDEEMDGIYFNKWYRMKNTSGHNGIIEEYNFTPVGKEIASLCDAISDETYLSDLINYYKEDGIVFTSIDDPVSADAS